MINQKEDYVYFSLESPWNLESLEITALPTNYLTAPPNPGYMFSYLRINKRELYLTRNYVAGCVMRPRRDRHVLKSCDPAFSIMLMSSAEMKGSLSLSMQSSFSAQLFFPLLILQ